VIDPWIAVTHINKESLDYVRDFLCRDEEDVCRDLHSLYGARPESHFVSAVCLWKELIKAEKKLLEKELGKLRSQYTKARRWSVTSKPPTHVVVDWAISEAPHKNDAEVVMASLERQIEEEGLSEKQGWDARKMLRRRLGLNGDA